VIERGDESDMSGRIDSKERAGSWAVSVYSYLRDTKVKIRQSSPVRVGGGKRGKVTGFSEGSRRNLMFLFRNTEGRFPVWIDLTYPGEYPSDGEVSKRHLRAFLAFLKRRGIDDIWKLEFQERGAPHYHLVVSKCVEYYEIQKVWDRIIGNDWKARGEKHSSSTSVGAIKSVAQLYYRVQKYFTKRDQTDVPLGYENVGRFWGCSRGLLRPDVRSKVGSYYYVCALTRMFRRWLSARAKFRFRKKWTWRGFGFTAYDGALFRNSLRR